MILTDKEIRKLVKEKKLIEPFEEEHLTPNGYDVSSNKHIYILPRQCCVVVTDETLKIPNNVVAQIWLKTRYARQGIQATFGMIDAGFEGTLALSLYNASQELVHIPKSGTVAQVVFIRLDKSVEKVYVERSGNYQNQGEELIK